MGATSSKLEDDKPLLLCQERKRFVREALDQRCSLAAAHFAYIQSLRNTGTALRKFVEPEAPTESSLYTSTSATPDPLALIEKSQFSNLSPSISQHLDTSDSFSPTPSPLSSERFHVNHMKASRSFSTTIEEKPMVSLTATVNTSSATPKRRESELDENSLPEDPPPPGTLPWDYFSLFHPVDNQFSFQEDKEFTHNLDREFTHNLANVDDIRRTHNLDREFTHNFENVDDIRRLREEEGIPELEEEGEKSPLNGKDDFSDSEDDFDHPSTEPLVRMFKNRNVNWDQNITNGSHDIPSIENFPAENEQQNEEKSVAGNGMYEADKASVTTPSKVVPPAISLPMNGKSREAGPAMKQAMDFFLCMKEIEGLFIKASDSGREVPRMLEADKIQFRPLFPEEIANRSKTSFLTSCFVCCTEEAPHPQASAPTEIKYLTWHRSMSSHSSSSRNPIGVTLKDGMEDLTGNLYSTICMNSGSHASTLDRLYAWERKLYDEVKASVAIRKEYDAKCRLLRDQESRAESLARIDKTRAAVKDLHSRIRVAIHRINSISKIIEELRDNELQPQLEELIGSLTRMWAVMLDCHKHQYNIISVAYNNGSTKVSLRSESLHQAVTVLEFELNALCSNFMKWISSQKSYLESINSWLLKCVFPLTRPKSKKKNVQFSPRTYIAPPIFVTCRDWLSLLDKLPAKDVTDALKDLATVVAHFLPRQEKGRGSSNVSMSFYRKGGQIDNLGADLHRNESPVNWNHNYDSLRSSLTNFLDFLKKFSSCSLEQYEALQKSINSARMAYENGGYRP